MFDVSRRPFIPSETLSHCNPQGRRREKTKEKLANRAALHASVQGLLSERIDGTVTERKGDTAGGTFFVVIASARTKER